MNDWIWLGAMILMGILGVVIGISLPPVEHWPPSLQSFWRGFVRGFSFGAIKPEREE